MATLAALAPSHRGRVVTAAVLGSAQVTLAITALVSEYDSLPGSWYVLALDIAVGVLSLALLPLTWRSPARFGLVLSALAAVSASATPAAGTAELWVARRRRLPVAVGVGLAGVAG